MSLILKAIEKDRDDRIFQQWVAQLPWMDKETFVSFADYRDRVTGANIDRRSVAEIEADMARVEQELKGGGDANGS
jgi:hypothetical protein